MATKGTAQDRWKRKDWYTVLSPDVFHNVEIGKILATEAKTLPGKRIDTTVYDVTNDPKKAHMKLLLEVTHLEGKKAHTKIREFELVRAYVRSLVRRRITKIEAVVSVEARDGTKLRIKPLVITASKCRSSQKGKIRRAIMKATFELAKSKTFEEFLLETLDEKIQSILREEIKKIYPVRNVEIRRIQIINPPVSIGRPKPKPEAPAAPAEEAAAQATGEEEPSEKKAKKRGGKKTKVEDEDKVDSGEEESEDDEESDSDSEDDEGEEEEKEPKDESEETDA
ncbi:MAG: 30S ribosomal protein S3ae [archaeon]